MAKLKETLDETKKRKKKEFIEQLKQFEKPRKDTMQDQHEKKVEALDFYNRLSNEDKATFHKELQNKKLRDSYIQFLKYIYPDFILTKFHIFLANIVQSVVEKVENGQTVRLLISTPPQHGKSTVVTKTLPAWFVGRNPKKWAILTAYNADIAEEFSDNNRQIIKNHGGEIFGVETNTSQDNKTLFQVHKIGEKEVPSSDSGIMGVGIGGGITGHGASLIIVDDPYKNSTEAENPNTRASISRVFKDSVLTRARGKGNAIIIIHTRWHEDDLIGELEKTGDWITINIPCRLDEGVDKYLGRKVGETLCPELGFDAEWSIRTEKALGKRVWNALYQGKPFVDGGNLINRSNIRFYDKATKPSVFDEIMMSCDLSFGGKKSNNDPACIGVWGRVEANHYLLARVKSKMTFIETINCIRKLCIMFPQCRKKIIERKANGQATVEMLNREIGGFVEYDPKSTTKVERFNLVVPYFESGNVYFPCESIEPNVEDDIQEMLRFPNGTHDDFVDMVSQYLLNYEYRYSGKIDTNSNFKTLADAIRGFRI